ncbi:glycoside hydrolase family 43 protein [Hypoxylon trugodes]|uniref:glycoside hydrolase family 43 protein n=1 Tax=Hypoxylon trugodes TaxID=326681 RepID=UPI00219C027E|nr:glycoside hydrolase family 43 protein [Hypoxylon trugodes]KAI1387143.1 glycoside hydrolase family 43 protein [Hypoxylon trugodes]
MFIQRVLHLAISLGVCLNLSLASPIDLEELGIQPERRADSSLVGYLGAIFLGADPYIYFYLSYNNDPLYYKILRRGLPILQPTKGTGGVRDPYIVQGGGGEAGQKWYIIGTDLDIGKTSWDAAQRTGSRGIFVWETSDLINYTEDRLVNVEDSSAGMVWAPEAIWDASKNQYLVHWASKFYSASDSKHTGSPSNIRIRYAYTSDFKTFSKPQTYIDYAPTNIIDLDILPLDSEGKNYLRFMKDETAKTVFAEYSTSGLFGTWTRAGGSKGTIASGVEGPAAFRDNEDENKIHVLLDFYGGDGYRPYESTDPKGNKWTASDRNHFPSNMRHGSILPLNETLYNAIGRKWWDIGPISS